MCGLHPWPLTTLRLATFLCATQALADFHRALDSDPKNATTRRRLAVVHDMFGVQLFNEGLVAQAEVEFSTARASPSSLSTGATRRCTCRYVA